MKWNGRENKRREEKGRDMEDKGKGSKDNIREEKGREGKR